jgi:hypothetical protein
VLAPLLVLAARFVPAGGRMALLNSAFFLVGAAVSGTNIGFQSLLLLIAPAARRPSYVGLMNSFLGPFMLLPAGAGWLRDLTSPVALLVGTAAMGVLAWSLATRLPQAAGPEGAEPTGHA